jgi:hypothetical protein
VETEQIRPDKASAEQALASARGADKEKALEWVKAKEADAECAVADFAPVIAR